MKYSPLSMSRRHVLGDLYSRCDAIAGSIPVYLDGDERQLLGHVDQSLGHFADAFSFFLDEDVCKRLSAGQYGYVIDYDNSSDKPTGGSLKLTSITLVHRTGYPKRK